MKKTLDSYHIDSIFKREKAVQMMISVFGGVDIIWNGEKGYLPAFSLSPPRFSKAFSCCIVQTLNCVAKS